jgi:hypothetical protein
LGGETTKWVGHQIFFEIYKRQLTKSMGSKKAGELVDALNVKEVK